MIKVPLELQILNTLGRYKKEGYNNFRCEGLVQDDDKLTVIYFDKGDSKKYIAFLSKDASIEFCKETINKMI